MEEISLKELNVFFLDTLQKCNDSIYQKEDDVVEYEVLEDFDIGIRTFLHDSVLGKLRSGNFISEEIRKLSQQLRQEALSIPEENWSIEEIRNSDEWRDVILLSSRILKLTNSFSS